MNMEGPLAPQACSARTASSRPSSQAKGVKLSRFVEPEISLHVLEHAGPGRRRPRARRRSRCAARWRWRYDVAEEIRVDPQRPGDRGAVPDSAGRRGPRPELEERASSYDPAGANALLDMFGYKTRRRRLAHAARRQAAGDPLRVAARHAGPPAGRDRGRSRSTRSASAWSASKDKFAELLKLEKQCKLQMRDGRVDRRLSRRRQLHAAPLRPEHRTRATTPARRSPSTTSSTRRSLRMPPAPGAQRALPRDDAHPRSLRAVAPRRSAATATCWSQPWVLGYKKHPILHATGSTSTSPRRASSDGMRARPT